MRDDSYLTNHQKDILQEIQIAHDHHDIEVKTAMLTACQEFIRLYMRENHRLQKFAKRGWWTAAIFGVGFITMFSEFVRRCH